jgi:Spy/CpxP family protein refolding chaperone
MRKLLGGVAVAAALVLGAATLQGCRGGHGHPKDPAQMAAFVNARVDDLLDDVDATPDQRTKIHAIADRMLAAAKQAHGGQDEVRTAALGQWRAETVDRAKLHALVDQRADALRKLAHQAVDAGADAHDVLTPPQREKLARKVERWHR